jgi:plasmid stabilization system protein ParE
VSKIVWLPEALEDIQRLRLFLEEKNPTAANRAGLILKAGAKRLVDFPERGYPMNDGTDRRELFLPFGTGGYVLRYMTDMEVVVIIRAWHSKEQRYKGKLLGAAGSC